MSSVDLNNLSVEDLKKIKKVKKNYIEKKSLMSINSNKKNKNWFMKLWE